MHGLHKVAVSMYVKDYLLDPSAGDGQVDAKQPEMHGHAGSWPAIASPIRPVLSDSHGVVTAQQKDAQDNERHQPCAPTTQSPSTQGPHQQALRRHAWPWSWPAAGINTLGSPVPWTCPYHLQNTANALRLPGALKGKPQCHPLDSIGHRCLH